ncbi:MAG: glycosyltransferase family 4 protein [Lishizhenia sp.]
MNIAVNTRFLLPTKMEGFGWYTFETISRIVKAHPEHQFYFFFDRKFDSKFVFAENVTPVVLNPPARHPILFKIWFNYSITKALKKYKCDAFISPDGYLSLKTKIPQLAVMHDLNFEHNPQDLPKSARVYLQKYFPKFAKKAKHICTVSNYSKQDIVKQYGINADKITVTYNGANPIFKPQIEATKTAIQLKYADGNEYILFVGALSPRKNLERLIKAFHKLKKEQKITQKLLIVGENLWRSNKIDLPKSLEGDIYFTGHLSQAELAKVMGSAFIFAFVPYFEGFGIPLLEAMQSGIPCLSGNLTSLPEVGGDAVHYCNPLDVEDIYLKLFELIECNDLRQNLCAKGLLQAQKFSWDYTAMHLWSAFQKMISA